MRQADSTGTGHYPGPLRLAWLHSAISEGVHGRSSDLELESSIGDWGVLLHGSQLCSLAIQHAVLIHFCMVLGLHQGLWGASPQNQARGQPVKVPCPLRGEKQRGLETSSGEFVFCSPCMGEGTTVDPPEVLSCGWTSDVGEGDHSGPSRSPELWMDIRCCF